MPKQTFILNGKPVTVNVNDDVRVLWVLRDLLGVTGPKYGCGINVCKACTSHLDGEAINPCVTPTADVAGREVTTIEGLADNDGTLHPMQEAFSRCHGLQCGFCTPGFVLTAVHLLENEPSPTREQIRSGLSGNICRCTGYMGIVDAVESVANSLTP